MSGVGEYKTRKGYMSGPPLVGFLAPDTHNACPKKATSGNGNAWTLCILCEGHSQHPHYFSYTLLPGGVSCINLPSTPATTCNCTRCFLRTSLGSAHVTLGA